MYVFNKEKKDIELRSFEGYIFIIPPGVSWIWDKAGEHLVTNIYKVEAKTEKDKYGFDQGHGVPALLKSDHKSWLKDGKKLTQVSRFKINASLIPRESLIKIAQERGVEGKEILNWLADKQIDKTEIASAINELPVSDEVRYPPNEKESNSDKDE